MVLLSNDEFLNRLAYLANDARESSFSVTFKRYDGHDRPQPRAGKPPLPVPTEYKCLIRAQSKSNKLSTIVSRQDVPQMIEAYTKTMRSSIDGLKKIKKTKTKSKASQG